jgi:hypothetical protein
MKAFPLPTTLAVALISPPLPSRKITNGVGDIRMSLHQHVGAHLSDCTPQSSRSFSAVLNQEGDPPCAYIN